MRPLAQATIVVALVVAVEYTVLLGGFLLPPPRPAIAITPPSPTTTVARFASPSSTIVPSATAAPSITPTTTATASPSPSPTATATPTSVPTNTPLPSPTPAPRAVSKSLDLTIGPRGSNQERVSLLRGQPLAGSFSTTGEVDFALRLVSPAQQTLLQQQNASGHYRFSWTAERDGQYAMVFTSTGPKPRMVTVSLSYTITEP